MASNLITSKKIDVLLMPTEEVQHLCRNCRWHWITGTCESESFHRLITLPGIEGKRQDIKTNLNFGCVCWEKTR